MAIYHKIPAKYLWLVPALFYAVIGIIDISVDAWHHKLTGANFFFNSLLIVPLAINRRVVHLLFGIISLGFTLYGFFALVYFFSQYMAGKTIRYPFDTFVTGPLFVLASLACSLSLIYSGSSKKPAGIA